MTATKKMREFDCDNEELEEFVGVIKTEFQDAEDRLLEAMIIQVVKDCRLDPFIQIRGRMQVNPIVVDAFEWLMNEHEDDIHTEMTFAWVCNELGWHPENFRRPLRKKFNRVFPIN